MSDLFSSAWNYISGGGGSDGGGAGSRFVGQEVDLGSGRVVKIRKVIAEGGYGYVFVAQEVQTGKEYALKRQVVASENVRIIKQEIAFLRQLRDHPHIVQLMAAASSPPSQTSHGNAEFIIMTELCSGGKLEDIVNTSRLSPGHVLRVFYQTCSAVAHMHSQNPPIIHRDLKVENLLLTSTGAIKLCDFGSATTQSVSPDHSWSATQRGLVDEEIQRNTTPMYRAPEMIDLYSNNPINEKADIWALGCLLYKLCFQEHPFEDSAKLRILSANYKLPPDDTLYTMFHGIIRSCLVVDPNQRPAVDAIIAQLYGIADQLGENLDQPLLELLNPSSQAQSPPANPDEGPDDNPSQVHAALHSTSQQAQKLFGFMKDGAGKLFKNIKDSSTTVIHQVASAAQGSKKPPLDIAYITSRILVMSFPHEDSHHANSLQEVREFLETRHPSQYLVFNLSGHSYDTSQLNNQVADFPWPHRCMPDLEKLVDLCRNLDSWLRADKENVIVVHCHDGRQISGLVVTAYLLFLTLFQSPLVPLKLFSFKRGPDLPPIIWSPSQLRYLQYIGTLVDSQAYKPHSSSVTLTTLRMTTVPLFNAIKTGCKPFVEVFQNGERVYTSATHNTMDNIPSFTAESGGVLVSLGAKVRGNIQVIVHHIRAIPLARKANMGMTAVRMFNFQFHTGFISPSTTTLVLDRHELDGPASKKEDKFPAPFQVLLEMEWNLSSEPYSPGAEISWQNLPHPPASPQPCFSSHVEQEEIMKQFAELDEALSASNPTEVAFHPHHSPQTHPPPQQPRQHNGGEPERPEGRGQPKTREEPTQSAKSFFSQLDWQAADSGYMAFAGSESESESSSSSGDEELFNHPNHHPHYHPHHHPHHHHHHHHGQGQHHGHQQQKFGTTLPPQANGSIVTNASSRQEEEARQALSGVKLVEFATVDEREVQSHPIHRPLPVTTVSPPASQHAQFGDFDPWGTTTSTARTMNLLDLEENLSPPSDSEQSEVRTVGTEAFQKASHSSQSSLGSSNQFDPFGPLSSDHGGEVFGNPHAFAHSTSSENLPAHTSPTQGNTFSSNFLTPQHGAPHLASKRHYSAPNVAALGNVTFAPTLSDIPQSPQQVRPGSLSPSAHTHPQSSTAPNYTPTWTTTSSGRTSPYGGLQLGTPSSHLGFQSQSTGNLQQQMGGGGGGGGRGRTDPFAGLGNVKQTAGATTGAASQKSQPTPQNKPPMTSRPTYQYYSQQPPRSQPQTQPFGQPTKGQPHKPNYSSVIGERSERGVRSKTGMRPSLKEDHFSDLLNVGFAKTSKGPTSLKDMKKQTDIETAIDPDRARVRAWAEGKERNIRAILSSLHTILWEGEDRWTECGMHQLVQPEQVKKMYRKACLSVHPDKNQGTEHENLARAIFDELNDAYTTFEESGARPLY